MTTSLCVSIVNDDTVLVTNAEVLVTMPEDYLIANGVSKSALKKLKWDYSLNGEDSGGCMFYSMVDVAPLLEAVRAKAQKKLKRTEEEMAKVERKVLRERETLTLEGVAKAAERVAEQAGQAARKAAREIEAEAKAAQLQAEKDDEEEQDEREEQEMFVMLPEEQFVIHRNRS
ncbi:hypothetical protein T492DRAFT_1090708 [Pavlovales sp. CCMP2436]|nr:hypothetical protein T492DRAFT_1090708 [Pavlovales sp. CCMP2436]